MKDETDQGSSVAVAVLSNASPPVQISLTWLMVIQIQIPPLKGVFFVVVVENKIHNLKFLSVYLLDN